MKEIMQKRIFTLFFLSVFIGGCSSNNHPDYVKLLPKQADSYSVFVVADSVNIISNEDLMSQNHKKSVSTINISTNLEEVKENYSDLEIKKKPTYIVFDNKEMIFSTHNQDELMNYLSAKGK